MSGGTLEYVMGYTTGSTIGVGGDSGITDLYSDFFTNSSWDKYYDEYTSTIITNYNYRILGDATGEMGSFGSIKDPAGTTRYITSWYGDAAHFIAYNNPWFLRGSNWNFGTSAGVFAFDRNTGNMASHFSYRIVLTP